MIKKTKKNSKKNNSQTIHRNRGKPVEKAVKISIDPLTTAVPKQIA